MPTITDPFNPDGKDWELAQSAFSRTIAKIRAHVNHDASAAIAQWAIYWSRHKKSTMPTEYDEVRPIPISRFFLNPALWGKRHVVVTDCSGACEIDASLAGVNENPAGEPWGGGNSSSFFNHALERFNDLKKLKVGNYVAYGAGGDEHLVVVVAMRPEPMVVSHGMPGGPFLQPLSLDTRSRTFLRVNTRAKRVRFPPTS